MRQCVGNKAVICPKVGLKDIFFIDKGVGKDYMKYFGKIAQKHVDFLLCDPDSMEPLCGIELDDISHTNKKAYKRDIFVEKVYNDANLELIRISSKSGYTLSEVETALTGVFDKSKKIFTIQNNTEIVLCPKCSMPMVIRKASKGQNAGKEFYGCPNFPKCKEIINIDC
ncbi:topoisomerase [Desulfitobacterium metallireducens DSM 15288]|uniref:Topoisomerase n=1 Tax=Desulfitobacterium metallireducens DSM 15288 TaxID=871968 RepID=W0ED56_9FIRM|nr:topoisomerase [Desulfitobacterium metallireducens DSM 15288]